MKSFFHPETFRHNHDYHFLEDPIRPLVREAFEKFMQQGYSPREISHVLTTMIWEEECGQILDHQLKRK